jgi:hypothetical protein
MEEMEKTVVTYWGELDITVTGDYRAGVKGRLYLKNGDPGYPDEPEEFEITKIEHLGKDITDQVPIEDYDGIEERCIVKINEEKEGYRDFD